MQDGEPITRDDDVAVFTETIKLDDQISAEAKRAALAIDTITKAMAATEKQLIKASALGDSGKVSAFSNKFAAFKGELATIPPPMKNVQSSSLDLQAELAELTGGLSVLVEIAGAVAIGFGALVIAGAAFAIKAAEAKGKIVGLFDALGEGKITGKDTVAMLDQLGDQIGQTRAQLAPLAKDFLTMGVTGVEQLRALTLAAASAGALAEGGAESFEKFFGIINAAAETGSKLTIPFKKLEKQLASVGLNIGDMAKQMGMTEAALTNGLKAGTIDAKAFGDALTNAATSKGAGPLANAGKQLGAIWARAQEAISKFFEDIDVGPFLAEVKSMFDILGQANPSGKALKSGIGAFFKEVFTSATKVVPMVKHFLLDLIIYGLKAYLALKPIVKSFNEWKNSAEGMKTISTVLSDVGTVLVVIAYVLGVAVVAFLALWAVMVGIGVVIWAFIAAVIAIPQIAGAALADFFTSAPQMALDFINGLVNGISSGASAVVGAVKSLAGSAKDAFTSALGIKSPSTVMMKLGAHTSAGIAEGIEGGAGDVHGAASGVADAAVKGASSPSASPQSGSSGGGKGSTVDVVFAAGSIVINGAGKGAAELSEEMISLAFERLVGEAGL